VARDISLASPRNFRIAVLWTLILGAAIVIIFTLIAKASLNVQGALTEKPDIAVLILLQEEGVEGREAILLRDLGLERDYVVETATGSLFVKLHKNGGIWQIAESEPLRAD